MSDELERQNRVIVFAHKSVTPANRSPWTHRSALLLNPCDGYHHVFARFDEDGAFCGFFDWAGSEPYSDTFYVAWALLPDSIALTDHFDPARGAARNERVAS